MEPLQEGEEELVRVLLVAPGKLRLCPSNPGLEIRGTDGLVLRGPEVGQNLQTQDQLTVQRSQNCGFAYLSELSRNVTSCLAVLVVGVLQVPPGHEIMCHWWR